MNRGSTVATRPHRDIRLPLLSSEWLLQWKQAGSPRAIPRSLDIVTSAIVLLSGELKTSTALDIASVIRILTQLTNWESYPDTLVLGTALKLLTDGDVRQFPGLNEPSSGTRIWLLKHAWLLRRRLSPELHAPLLLNNVEATLGGWDLSLALCRALYRSEREFWNAVDQYTALAMPDQFRTRMAAARTSTGWDQPDELVEHEREVRRFLANRLAAQFDRPIVLPTDGVFPPPFSLTN